MNFMKEMKMPEGSQSKTATTVANSDSRPFEKNCLDQQNDSPTKCKSASRY